MNEFKTRKSLLSFADHLGAINLTYAETAKLYAMHPVEKVAISCGVNGVNAALYTKGSNYYVVKSRTSALFAL